MLTSSQKSPFSQISRSEWGSPTLKSPAAIWKSYSHHGGEQQEPCPREVASQTCHICFPDTKGKCLLLFIQHSWSSPLTCPITFPEVELPNSRIFGGDGFGATPPSATCPCSSNLELMCQYKCLMAGQLPSYQTAVQCSGRIQTWTSTNLNSGPSFVINLIVSISLCVCSPGDGVFWDQVTSEIPFYFQIFLIWFLHNPVLGIVWFWLNIKHDFSSWNGPYILPLVSLPNTGLLPLLAMKKRLMAVIEVNYLAKGPGQEEPLLWATGRWSSLLWHLSLHQSPGGPLRGMGWNRSIHFQSTLYQQAGYNSLIRSAFLCGITMNSTL